MSYLYRRIFKTLESEREGEDFLILDATFYKKQWRERVEALARDERVLTIYIECPRELAVKRNRERRPNIAERALSLIAQPPVKPLIDIPRMAEAAQKMLKDSLDAFVARDADLAMSVCEADDFVDNLNHQIFNELLMYMLQDPRNISRAVRLTYITKYLERIADHATNIAEMVVFMVKGKVIRHIACEARKEGRRP